MPGNLKDELAALRVVLDKMRAACWGEAGHNVPESLDQDPDYAEGLRLLEAIDKSRTVDMSVVMPDLSESVCRGLLEMGFDTGVQACVPQLKTVEKTGSLIAWEPPLNPFRRAITTITEAEPVLECDCPGRVTGEHFNECLPDRPWKKRV